MTVDKDKLKALAERAASKQLAGRDNPIMCIAVPAADVLALLAEIERLEAVALSEIVIAGERAKEVCGARMRLHTLSVEIERLKAEIEALRKGADVTDQRDNQNLTHQASNHCVD
jgi:hypothetical protein